MLERKVTKFGLLKQIKEDFNVAKNNDPALQSKLEMIFNYPGVWAIVNHRIAHKLYVNGFKRTARIYSGISQFLTNVDIHPAAQIGRRVFIDHGIGVVIGETSVIDEDVLIYQGVTLGGVSLNKEKRHPTIRANTVLGSGAKILGNIVIGKNSKVGANSVVISDVPAYSTAVGIPARVIKRYDNLGKFTHNDLPDIHKEGFIYLNKKIEVLEKALRDKDIISSENLYELNKSQNTKSINYDLLDGYFIDGAGI